MRGTSKAAFLLGPQRIAVRSFQTPEPGPGELLVQVGAATTCGTDLKVYRRGGHPRMLTPPCPFGHELAGTVLAHGSSVNGWRSGERVVILNSSACGRCAACEAGRENLCEDLHYVNGAFSDTLLVPARFVRTSTYRCPDSVPFELAALTEPLACVVHGVERCELSGDESVAVFGAGPIGLMFTAVLSYRGHHVTLVDRIAHRLRVGQLMGAARIVDLAQDAIEELHSAPEAVRRIGQADVIVEATGQPEAWSDAFACVRPGGTIVLYGGYPPEARVTLDTHALHYSELTIRGAYHHRPATVRQALELLESGEVDLTPLLSGQRPLEHVEDALQAMARHEALKVVIRP